MSKKTVFDMSRDMTSTTGKNITSFIPEIWSKKLTEKFMNQMTLDLDKMIMRDLKLTTTELMKLVGMRAEKLKEEGMEEEAIKRDLEGYIAGMQTLIALAEEGRTGKLATDKVKIPTWPSLKPCGVWNIES